MEVLIVPHRCRVVADSVIPGPEARKEQKHEPKNIPESDLDLGRRPPVHLPTRHKTPQRRVDVAWLVARWWTGLE